MLEGVLGIAEGLNPKLIRIKLEAYAPPPAPRNAPKKAPAENPATAAASQSVQAAGGE
jgi:hypothetical protein